LAYFIEQLGAAWASAMRRLLSESIGEVIAFTIAHMAKLKVFSYIFNGPEAGFIRALSWALL